jgi:hypothetical protein
MATTTDIYAAVELGSPGVSAGNANKLTLQESSATVQIHTQLTNGAGVPSAFNAPTLYYAVSPFDMTAEAAMVRLAHVARTLKLLPSNQPGTSLDSVSDAVLVTGAYLYTWISHPNLSPALTLNAKAVEI